MMGFVVSEVGDDVGWLRAACNKEYRTENDTRARGVNLLISEAEGHTNPIPS
jgi:hypothetical protein